VHSQLAQFGQVEVHRVIASVCPCAPGKALCHIGGAFEINIVQYHGDAVFTQDNVLFDIIRAHGVRHGLGGKGVLRQVTAGAAMRDNDRDRCCGCCHSGFT
jgi:hypothetical protein